MAAWACFLVLPWLSPTSAQEPPDEPQPAHVTGKDLILQAFENNADLRMERLNVERNDAILEMQRAVWVPQFSMSGSSSDNVSIQNAYSYSGPDPYALRNEFITNKYVETQLSQQLITGAQLALVAREENYANSVYSQQNSAGQYYYPLQETWTTRVFASISQPLLRRAGVDATMAEIRIARLGKKAAGQLWKMSLSRIAAAVYRKHLDLYLAQAEMQLVNEAIHHQQQAQIQAGKNPEEGLDPLRQRVAALKQTIDTLNASLIHDVFPPPRWQQASREVTYRVAYIQEPPLNPPDINDTELGRVVMDSPEYRVASQVLEQQKLRQHKSGNDNLPNLDVYGKLGYVGYQGGMSQSIDQINGMQHDEWEIGVRFSIPLSDKRAEAMKTLSQCDVDSASYRLERLTYDMQERLGGILRTCRAQYGSYKDARKKREELQEQLLIGPTKPDQPKLSVEHAAQFRQNRMTELNALVNYEKTLVEWEMATGNFLGRLGFSTDDPPGIAQ